MQVQTLRLYHQVIQLNYSDAYIIKRKERNKNVRYIYGKKISNISKGLHYEVSKYHTL